MDSPKDLFVRDKTDVKDALKITKGDIFPKMVAYALAQFSRMGPTEQQAQGANNFINILWNLPEEDIEAPDWITSGLKHDLSVPDRTAAPEQQTKK